VLNPWPQPASNAIVLKLALFQLGMRRKEFKSWRVKRSLVLAHADCVARMIVILFLTFVSSLLDENASHFGSSLPIADFRCQHPTLGRCCRWAAMVAITPVAQAFVVLLRVGFSIQREWLIQRKDRNEKLN
jgi:hypothetical protein